MRRRLQPPSTIPPSISQTRSVRGPAASPSPPGMDGRRPDGSAHRLRSAASECSQCRSSPTARCGGAHVPLLPDLPDDDKLAARERHDAAAIPTAMPRCCPDSRMVWPDGIFATESQVTLQDNQLMSKHRVLSFK